VGAADIDEVGAQRKLRYTVDVQSEGISPHLGRRLRSQAGVGGFRCDTSLIMSRSSSEGPYSCACSDYEKHFDELVTGSRLTLRILCTEGVGSTYCFCWGLARLRFVHFFLNAFVCSQIGFNQTDVLRHTLTGTVA